MDIQEVTVVAVGALVVLVALLVEIEHKVIWKHYQKNYHQHQNKLVDRLLKPNIWVYRLNIYIVWPLVLILGVAIIYINLQ